MKVIRGKRNFNANCLWRPPERIHQSISRKICLTI